jgi:hypothetical protein
MERCSVDVMKNAYMETIMDFGIVDSIREEASGWEDTDRKQGGFEPDDSKPPTCSGLCPCRQSLPDAGGYRILLSAYAAKMVFGTGTACTVSTSLAAIAFSAVPVTLFGPIGARLPATRTCLLRFGSSALTLRSWIR